MYNVHLTHSLLCFEFVELTLYYMVTLEMSSAVEFKTTYFAVQFKLF